jgi:predicted RNase H-related nuclease YkuK (DUF458 family)
MKWKDLSNEKEIDLAEYVRQYLIEKPNTQLFIGTDSQSKGSKTYYALVVVLYNEKKGGKVLFTKFFVPVIKDKWSKLWKEVELSLDVAAILHDSGIRKSLLTIDLDYNTDEKYYSNTLLTSAVGFAKGMGYECRSKPDSPAASNVADMLVKA